MRRFVKPAVWTAVFLACAGAGAFVAAHTDPFPPGVDRPTGTGATGGGPTGVTGPSPSPATARERWMGSMPIAARHVLYVGGACRSRWRTELRLVVDEDGSIRGTGVAIPVGEASCDFPQAQQQASRIRLGVQGSVAPDGTMRIAFGQARPVPPGTTDVGGVLVFFAHAQLSLDAGEGRSAEEAVRQERSDGNRGTYTFHGSIRVGCRTGCGA
jgi:hypothetical protein